MEVIIVHPGNAEQSKTVEAILTALAVPFEKKEAFPAHVAASIEKGLKQYENGKHTTLNEFKAKYFSKKKI